MKLFLATSFSGQVDSIKHEVLPEYRQFVENLLASLRAQPDIQVFAAIEQEDWRLSEAAPEVGVTAYLAQINESEVILATTSAEISAGVQFEIGYALGKGKRVLLARSNTQSLSYFNQGAVSAGLLTLLTYDNVAMLVEQIGLALNTPSEASINTFD